MYIKWFQKKKNGLYFVPVAWQGWLLAATYILSVIISLRNITATSPSVNDTVIKFAPLFIAYSIIMYLIALNTSGKIKLK